MLMACSDARPPVDVVERPLRVVSLDYCADQFVIELLDRDQILAVSPDATARFSYLREEAVGLPTVRAVAEDVLVLKPDLVVRSYGGGPNARVFFEQAGIAVLNVGWASDIPGVMRVIEDMATGLNVPDRGAAIVAAMHDRLAALADATDALGLYMTPAGVTTGPGSLVHEMLVAAGLQNFQEAPGWRPIPLERLAYEQPDLVAAAFFETRSNHFNTWSPMRHPIARAQLDEQPVVPLEGAWTACGGWFLLDAIEALAGHESESATTTGLGGG
ncbi:MAG: ABC transporter substrate-binding protein [Pseudomonadota bacterium]